MVKTKKGKKEIVNANAAGGGGGESSGDEM